MSKHKPKAAARKETAQSKVAAQKATAQSKTKTGNSTAQSEVAAWKARARSRTKTRKATAQLKAGARTKPVKPRTKVRHQGEAKKQRKTNAKAPFVWPFLDMADLLSPIMDFLADDAAVFGLATVSTDVKAWRNGPSVKAWCKAVVPVMQTW